MKITTLLALCTIGNSYGASVIALNFLRNPTTTPALNDGSEYGISSWVDVDSSTGSTTEDGVTVSWNTTGTWGSGSVSNNIERGYLDNFGIFTITGLGAWLTANSVTEYTVQLSQASDTATNWFGNSLITDTGSSSLVGTLTNSNLQYGLTSVSGPLTADSITVDPTTGGTAPAGGSGSRTNVAGLIITAVPEPSSTVLFGSGALALLLYRRK